MLNSEAIYGTETDANMKTLINIWPFSLIYEAGVEDGIDLMGARLAQLEMLTEDAR